MCEETEGRRVGRMDGWWTRDVKKTKRGGGMEGDETWKKKWRDEVRCKQCVLMQNLFFYFPISEAGSCQCNHGDASCSPD